MADLKVLELVVAMLFPLALVGLLVSLVASQRGRTRAQIVRGVAGIVACAAAVVAVGVALRASRGYALIEYGHGSLGLGQMRMLDWAGLVACAGMLGAALILVRRLTAETPADDDGGEKLGTPG